MESISTPSAAPTPTPPIDPAFEAHLVCASARPAQRAPCDEPLPRQLQYERGAARVAHGRRLLHGAAAAALMLAGTLALPARAADSEGVAYKFTLGRYLSSDGNPAWDANLRGGQGPHTAWLGVYRDRAGLQQWRSGYEFRSDGEWLRSALSLQNASGGTWVGAATAELGGTSYAIVGWGRTNLRDYINLNYDPNDAITLGVGTRALAGTELTLFHVRDDRTHSGQQVTHAVLRWRFGNAQRLTVDLSSKRGLTGDGVFVRGNSVTLGYDHGPGFVRLAHDPHAGFSLPTQNRISFGFRF